MSNYYQREGVLLDSGFASRNGCVLYSVWLIYEVEELKITLDDRTRLKAGDWVRIEHTATDYDRVQKIPPILPTEVVNGSVRIKTTVVFDTPANVKIINDRGDFLATARYFGLVEACAKLIDLVVPAVAYNGVSVERRAKYQASTNEKWFIAEESIRHPSKECHSNLDEPVGPFEGVVVSLHRSSSFIWNPLLGEGILKYEDKLENGDWVEFFVISSSLRKRHQHPNIHFEVAKWRKIRAILLCQPCRNTLKMVTTVNVGDCIVNATKTGVVFADWIGPILDKSDILYKLVTGASSNFRHNQMINVVVIREKRSRQERIAVWNITDAKLESESTTAAIKSDDRFVSDSVSIFTNDDNVMGGFGRGNAVRGRRGVQGPDGWDTVPIADDESSQEWHSGKQIVDDEDRLSTASSTAYLEDMATTSRSGFNAPTGLQPSNGYSSAPMLRMDSERHEEELLTHSLRLLGQLFKNSEIRDTIKDALPDDYRLLYRYYGES